MGEAAIKTEVCVVGGGPAGMVLGLLLSRAGVDTVVLEKHADFFRDFRGDTVHPSTLDIFKDLGLVEQLLSHPHQKAFEVRLKIGDEELSIADFKQLSKHHNFVAFMPQHEFLNFVRDAASVYPAFHLHMETEAYQLIEDKQGVHGVWARQAKKSIQIRAPLVVGADGRNSVIRRLAQLGIQDLGAPIDVLWFHLSRLAEDPDQFFGRINQGKVMVMLNRATYWQCAFIIAKGSFEQIKSQGLSQFQAEIAETMSFLKGRVSELQDWDAVKLLTVRLDRLNTWARPGLLCIGDAAHAMSPVGGVGINLAIQDAVATANILTKPILEKRLNLNHLKQIQKRREFPVRVIQGLQALFHRKVLGKFLGINKPVSISWFMRLLNNWKLLQRIPAYMIGVGIRPEHPEL